MTLQKKANLPLFNEREAVFRPISARYDNLLTNAIATSDLVLNCALAAVQAEAS
jgi:hypothetical protein